MMRRIFLCAFLLLCRAWELNAESLERQEFGYKEIALIYPPAKAVVAKLDTGADVSSLEARNIKIENKVATFELGGRTGESFSLSLPVVGYAKIKRHGSSKPMVRPTVRVSFCLGNTMVSTIASLADRERFDSALLVGRNALNVFATVNPSLIQTVRPQCKKAHYSGQTHRPDESID